MPGWAGAQREYSPAAVPLLRSQPAGGGEPGAPPRLRAPPVGEEGLRRGRPLEAQHHRHRRCGYWRPRLRAGGARASAPQPARAPVRPPGNLPPPAAAAAESAAPPLAFQVGVLAAEGTPGANTTVPAPRPGGIVHIRMAEDPEGLAVGQPGFGPLRHRSPRGLPWPDYSRGWLSGWRC